MLHSSCLVLSCLVYRATPSPVNALRWLHSSTWKKHRSQSNLKNGFKKVPREYDINFAPKIGKCFKNCRVFFAQKWARMHASAAIWLGFSFMVLPLGCQNGADDEEGGRGLWVFFFVKNCGRGGGKEILSEQITRFFCPWQAHL